ncbi:MAG: SDR family oxidoreductase [Verrucomicrobiota bacterium]
MDRNLLVIGGSSGIGEQLARLLVENGDRVYLASRSQGENHPSEAEYQSFDVKDRSAVLELPDVLHGVVYCPGSINLKPFARLSDDDFVDELEVNYLGAARVLRQALPALKKSGSASVVLFSTVAVQTGLPYHASIAGAKGAVEGIARSLAAELAPTIRVNCLALSLTDTPLAANLLSSEEKRKASADRHPLKRIGDPAEVAKMAAFLLSEDSGFMTGQVIQVDGGISSLKML